jgi:hypothetical protein
MGWMNSGLWFNTFWLLGNKISNKSAVPSRRMIRFCVNFVGNTHLKFLRRKTNNSAWTPYIYFGNSHSHFVQFLTCSLCHSSWNQREQKCRRNRARQEGWGELVIRAELRDVTVLFRIFRYSKQQELGALHHMWTKWFVAPPLFLISPALRHFTQVFDNSNLRYLADVIRQIAYLLDKPEIYSF